MVLVGLLRGGEGEVEVEVADMGAETGIGVGEGLCFGKFVCMGVWYACSCSA